MIEEKEKFIPSSLGHFDLLEMSLPKEESKRNNAILLALEAKYKKEMVLLDYKIIHITKVTYLFIWIAEKDEIKKFENNSNNYFSELYHKALEVVSTLKKETNYHIFLSYDDGYLSIGIVDNQIVYLNNLNTKVSSDLDAHLSYLLPWLYETYHIDIMSLGKIEEISDISISSNDLFIKEKADFKRTFLPKVIDKHIKNYIILILVGIILPLSWSWYKDSTVANNEIVLPKIERTYNYSEMLSSLFVILGDKADIAFEDEKGKVTVELSDLDTVNQLLKTLEASSYFSDVSLSTLENEMDNNYEVVFDLILKES